LFYLTFIAQCKWHLRWGFLVGNAFVFTKSARNAASCQGGTGPPYLWGRPRYGRWRRKRTRVGSASSQIPSDSKSLPSSENSQPSILPSSPSPSHAPVWARPRGGVLAGQGAARRAREDLFISYTRSVGSRPPRSSGSSTPVQISRHLASARPPSSCRNAGLFVQNRRRRAILKGLGIGGKRWRSWRSTWATGP
jgi:hypothetical protein